MEKIREITCFWYCSSVALLISLAGCKKQSVQQQAKEQYRLACAQLTGQRSEQDMRRALGLVEDALILNYDVQYEALKATLLIKLGQLEEGNTCFKHALTATHDASVAAEIKNNYACSLAQLGHAQEAFMLLKELVHDPHYLTPEVAWVNLGKWYVDHRNIKQAQQCFANAAKLEPTYVDAHFYGAIASYGCGQLPTARSQLTTLLSLEPEHQGGRRLLKILGCQERC